MKKGLFIFFFACLAGAASAQVNTFDRELNFPVTINGQVLVNPWAGGEDAPILQPIDMNGDGIKDLFMFEKTQDAGTHRISTFINNGTPGQVDYHYAPEYIEKFPAGLHDWVLLVDYNCDGKEDIFTYSYIGGMTVYRNDYTTANGLKFTQYVPLIYSTYFTTNTNLYVSSVNQPALVDMDNDGDLDVLTFSLAGNFLQYHQNTSMENYGNCDTLEYHLEKDCWGGVCLSPSYNSAILGCCFKSNDPDFTLPDENVYLQRMLEIQQLDAQHGLHSGSCMIAPDIDGDGDKDPINGDILGDNLLLLMNGGSAAVGDITGYDSCYPSYNLCTDLKTFPSPHYFDADNDGNKDLVVAPCIYNSSRNFDNILFYKNTTNNITNQFSYQGDSLLVNDMIDVGTGAHVAVVDIDGDNLLDMVIGNFRYVYQTQADDSRLAYFRNTGTAGNPEFTLVTNDFAGLSATGLYGLAPAFGDMDKDGDADMIVGSDDGYLNYYTNNGGNFTLTKVHMEDATSNPINVGNVPIPHIVDLNRDGKLDLVIGERNGNLNYYENTGTTSSYTFTFVTNSLGGVNTTQAWKSLYGYSYPYFHDDNGNYVLYCGTLSGYVHRYDNIDGNLAGTFTLTDSMMVNEPIESTVSGGDIDNDGLIDLLVGNKSGGVIWYKGGITSVNEHQGAGPGMELYPNPVSDYLNILVGRMPADGYEVLVTDIRGRTVFSARAGQRRLTVATRAWSEGVYICRVVTGTTASVAKFVVRH